MKQFLGTLAGCIISLYSIAQTSKVSVSGSVIDAATKKPLSSASIKLGNTVAIADEDGLFTFKKVFKGSYHLVATSIGYSETSEEVEVADGKANLVIQLKNSPFFLQSLEVKSLRASDKAPFTKTNLSKEELAKTNLGQDLPFMLKQTPSVVINSDAGNGVGYTNIYIRGVDASRINVTLNGIPYNDAESQGSYFVDLPDFTSSLNSIQIQRGVGTSSNGTGAFGAGINLQTNEFNEKAYAEINNSYGSFNTIKNTVKFGTGLFNEHFTVDGRLSRIVSDGYVDRASSNLQSFSVSAAYIDKNSSLRLNIFSGKEKTYQAWYGVPEDILPVNRTYNYCNYANQTDNYQQNHYQLFYNHSFNSKWSFSTALFLTKGKGYYEEYSKDAYYSSYGLPDNIVGKDTLTTTDLIRQRWLDNQFYGQILSFQYKKDKDQLIVGGGWNRYEGNHFGTVLWAKNGGVDNNYQYYFNQALKTDENIYAKWEHQQTKHLLFYADLQYKHVMHKMDGFDGNPTRKIQKEFSFFNPKLGITYSVNGWQVYGSWAVANKEPNRTDFEYATDNNPKPEQLNDFELGVEKRTSAYSYGVTVYYMDYKNQLVLTGKLNDAGYAIRTNTPHSYRAGLELQGSVVISNWLNAVGNVTFSSNKIKQFTEHLYVYDSATYEILDDTIRQHNKSDISFSPNTIAAATINLLPCKYVEISLISKYVSRQYLDNTQDKKRSVSDYFTQDVRASINLKGKLFKEISIIGQVNNVFNILYESYGSTYPSFTYNGGSKTQVFTNGVSYFPMSGTNYMVGLNVKL